MDQKWNRNQGKRKREKGTGKWKVRKENKRRKRGKTGGNKESKKRELITVQRLKS